MNPDVFAPGRASRASLKLLAISVLIVLVLLLCSRLSDRIGFLVSLYPGEIAGLLVMGGHGSIGVIAFAMVLSLVVNTTMYMLLGRAVVSATRTVRRH